MILLILFLLTGFCATAQAAELLILDDGGKQVFSAPVSDDCGFAITYTHSVALTPVTDYFYLKNGEIWLDKTEYKDFGAGLPFSPAENETMQFDRDHIILKNLHIRVSPFSLRVGRIANHELLLLAADKGVCAVKRKIPFTTFAKAGKALVFEGKP